MVPGPWPPLLIFRVKLVLSASLKMFQECFHMFQSDLETRLLLSVLNRDSNFVLKYLVTWLATLNSENPKQ